MPDYRHMHKLPHLLLIPCYAAVAVGLALQLPRWQPQVAAESAMLGAAALFLACALLHEICGRIGREAALNRRLEVMSSGQDELRDDLSWSQKEIELIRESLEAGAAAGRGEDGRRALEEVAAEVKVLKSLVARLSEDGSAAKAGVKKSLDADAPAVIAAAESDANLPINPEIPDEARIVDLVREALRDDRVELVLQPIVSLPQRKRRFFECYSRLSTADGTVVVPEQYIEIAEREGMITAIDNMLLFRCIQLIRRTQRSSQNIGFFCNVSSHTLRDEDFFRDLVEYLEHNSDLGPSLVFEFAQAGFPDDGAESEALLGRLARLGCRFSVDRVRDLDFDVEALARRHVDFVKIEAEAFLTGEAAQQAALLALKRRLDRIGIDLIAEKIESEEALRQLHDFAIDFGQGYLFGEPRPAKAAA